MNTSSVIRYEDFGAVGDGVTDDLEAIVQAHETANKQRLPVESRPDAIYNLGSRSLTVPIQTSTNWSSSRFIINDRDAEDHTSSLFVVSSMHDEIPLEITQLQRDQRHLNVPVTTTSYVQVECADIKRFRRQGLNENEGFPQRDCFIVHSDGRIEGDIDWDYSSITQVTAQPIDEEPLIIRGGVFTTIANNMYRESGYHYWQRNITILRSRTEVVGLTHYVTGETEVGCPYGGFLACRSCAHITIRDCFVSGHRTYTGNGSAGKPVRMGTYDITARDVIGFRLIGVRMNHITDRLLWGVIETNFCKNILLEDCVLSRMDAHMGVSGFYTIRRCHLGHVGLNAVGRGQLTIEDSITEGPHLIAFRGDFGATWEGNVTIRNTRWRPSCGDKSLPYLFNLVNSGQHDFGYPCYMPETIEIDHLEIDDSNHPDDYSGPWIFCDAGDVPAEQPYPYHLCQRVRVSNIKTLSGKPLNVAQTARVRAYVEYIER